MANEQSMMAVIRASRPSFRNAHDKIAFAVHSSFLASGYVLNATGPAAFSDNALSSTSTDEVGIDGWNEFGEYYGFVYSKPDKGSKKVLVKCLPMNDKLLVDALSDGDSEPLHLEIDVGDYVGEEESSSCSSQFKNLGKLVSTLDKEILSKLNGSSTAVSSIQPSSSGTRESLRDNPNLLGVGVAEPRDAQPYPSGIVSPQVNPVCRMDVIPGPPPGMCPIRGGLGRGGGMFVGPDHPLSHGIGRGQPGVSSGIPPGCSF
ncbi:hypothetical protein F0562_016656 [Nyssa sinensis]|uniref:PI31 proteasome regulator N-terminal domain-containing protein n=1 Tax=Nyssa sinensis TaxID=561372 RepID=A0A5J4ZCL3_9ASTE|nr:hypothetical protein F0562_016656 [Nyssa sinensis]